MLCKTCQHLSFEDMTVAVPEGMRRSVRKKPGPPSRLPELAAVTLEKRKRSVTNTSFDGCKVGMNNIAVFLNQPLKLKDHAESIALRELQVVNILDLLTEYLGPRSSLTRVSACVYECPG